MHLLHQHHHKRGRRVAVRVRPQGKEFVKEFVGGPGGSVGPPERDDEGGDRDGVVTAVVAAPAVARRRGGGERGDQAKSAALEE